MAFQSTININQAFGYPGDRYVEGPWRAESHTLNSSGAAQTVGFAFTKDASTGVAQVGGTVGTGRIFGGILVQSKQYASFGTTSGTLAPTLNVPDQTQGDLCVMGTVIVYSNTACSIGDLVVYDQTTGAISTVAAGSGSAGTGKGFVPNATVYKYPTAAAGLIAIRITN